MKFFKGIYHAAASFLGLTQYSKEAAEKLQDLEEKKEKRRRSFRDRLIAKRVFRTEREKEEIIMSSRGLKLWRLADGSSVWALNLKNAVRKAEKKLGVGTAQPRMIYPYS